MTLGLAYMFEELASHTATRLMDCMTTMPEWARLGPAHEHPLALTHLPGVGCVIGMDKLESK